MLLRKELCLEVTQWAVLEVWAFRYMSLGSDVQRVNGAVMSFFEIGVTQATNS